MKNRQRATEQNGIRPAYAAIEPTWCQISGMSRSGTYLALRAGHLTARKVGGRPLIAVPAGLAWIAAQPAYNA